MCTCDGAVAVVVAVPYSSRTAEVQVASTHTHNNTTRDNMINSEK
jgi:hypothetical protein